MTFFQKKKSKQKNKTFTSYTKSVGVVVLQRISNGTKKCEENIQDTCSLGTSPHANSTK